MTYGNAYTYTCMPKIIFFVNIGFIFYSYKKKDISMYVLLLIKKIIIMSNIIFVYVLISMTESFNTKVYCYKGNLYMPTFT